jgi:chorismate synthase
MSFTAGNRFKLTLFGQSHAPAVGGVLDGLPAGEELDIDKALTFLRRRSPGASALSSTRKEADIPQVLSGLFDGKTCGAPLAFLIPNTDVRPGDYETFRSQPRPSHADFPALIKYGEAHDIRGGGFFSARLTAALCFAGALAMQMLKRRGITIGAHIARIAGIDDAAFDPVKLTAEDMQGILKSDFPVIDQQKGAAMKSAVLSAKDEGDSVGGVIECAALGLPAGLGEPVFGGLENMISRFIFAVPAVKGIEFGAGFGIADMKGSQANDPYTAPDCISSGNNSGGILGGLSTGMPLIFRAAFKPAPSIPKAQKTWNRVTGQAEELIIQGRHDPCVVPRAVPCVEAAAAAALLDAVLM